MRRLGHGVNGKGYGTGRHVSNTMGMLTQSPSHTSPYRRIMGALGAALVVVFLVITGLLPLIDSSGWAEEQAAFSVHSFLVEGNSLLSEKSIQDVLRPFLGLQKTAADVEKARDALEKFYHEKGYPAVLVNIPEQTVEEGTVQLQVIESKIGNVRVTGNRWHTKAMIMHDLPSIEPGKVLYLPDVRKDLQYLNRGEDMKVSPVLSPGRETGTTDVEIKVEDRLPVHGSLELNNRNTHDTTELRLNGMLRYDNLWQKDHSIAGQFQISPEETSEVRLYSLSYTLPAPWAKEHQIALYGLHSDSNTTTFGQDLLVTGKGTIVGARYVIPLTPYDTYVHNLTIGADYKDFQELTGFSGDQTKTPIRYAPMSFSYNSSYGDMWGATRFSGGLNVAFRHLVTDQSEFLIKRFQARGDYMYVTAGVERDQKLPAGMSLFLKVDGQIADQPLISNEQYSAGGMQSVRGYKEAEAMGDDAFHGTAELSAPDLAPLMKLDGRLRLTPFAFFDYAWVKTKQPLEGQDEIVSLSGVGLGIRGTLLTRLYYETDYALSLRDTDKTDKYHGAWYFKLGVQF